MATGRKPSSAEPAALALSRPSGRSAKSSIESARRRLGGRASAPSTRPPGSFVQVTLKDGTTRPGVVLWASEQHCDVWFEDGSAKRARLDALARIDLPITRSLWRVAAEMRLFAQLVDGDRVRWERAAEIAEGCIVEKCRYGAIIVTRDGKLVAVGFRRLWPAKNRDVS